MNKTIAKLYCKCIKNKEKRKFIYDIIIGKNKLHDYIYSKELYHKKYEISGENNKIILIENGNERILGENECLPGLEIKINGNNNLIKLELPINISDTLIEIGNSNVFISIEQTNRLCCSHIRCCYGDSQFLSIGKNTTISGISIYLDEQSSCIIGKDCKFSNNINIWPTDGHAILDNDTGEIVNTASEPIIIGDHVWVGQGVRITKNARIGNNCIIGGGTVACKDYKEDNVIIAGNPGKIIKQNINWDRRNPYHLKLERNKKTN